LEKKKQKRCGVLLVARGAQTSSQNVIWERETLSPPIARGASTEGNDSKSLKKFWLFDWYLYGHQTLVWPIVALRNEPSTNKKGVLSVRRRDHPTKPYFKKFCRFGSLGIFESIAPKQRSSPPKGNLKAPKTLKVLMLSTLPFNNTRAVSWGEDGRNHVKTG